MEICIWKEETTYCCFRLHCNELVLFYCTVCYCGKYQVVSHEVAELKNEKMKSESLLVASSDTESATKEREQLAVEKKVNSLVSN